MTKLSLPLRCVECRRTSDERARGWRAMVAEEWETDCSLFTVVYCPECAVHEFGG